MKLRLFIAAMLAVYGSSAVAQETRRQCELVDAKYKGGEPSRIVLMFSEPVRYLHKKLGDNSIRLSFPNTGSAKYASRVPVIFKSGLAKTLAFDFSREDTLAVVVTFRDHVAYDLRNVKNKIVVEMRAADTASVVARLVDIRALAQEQIVEAKANTSHTTRDSSGFPDIQLLPLVIAVFVSLLGTLGLMRRIARKSGSGKRRSIAAVRVKQASQSGVDAILAQAQLILQEKSGSVQRRVSSEAPRAEYDGSPASVAKRFGRGQGETHLVKAMGKSNRHYPWEQKLQQLDTQRVGKESVATAKKLGVGRGELNLALTLRRMQETHTQKEHVK